MLEINDLTYRIAGRILFDGASAFIAEGWKVGLVGRNGTGKSTLLRLICDEITQGGAAIKCKRGARMGFVAQEAAPSDETIMQTVLDFDQELAELSREAETATDPDRIGEIHMRLGEIDAYSAESRAAEILMGLGFAQADFLRAVREFSGGWRMRAALAGVLFSKPDLLILDEPTNYLDLEGAAWLEGFLRQYPYTVVVVSHDREMLNRSVTHILALNDQKLELHAGGYDNYLRKRAERMALASGMKAKQDAERAHLQSFVDRFRAKASKARQAQSRIKRLEKMQEISVPLAERALPFSFASPAELAAPLITLEDADLGYHPGIPVLHKVNFRLDPDDRIVIIGPNGQGKTTLVKSIGERLALLSGKRFSSRQVRVGYFSQDQLDELRAGETVLDHVRDLEPGWTQGQHRAMAAQMGFGREKIETRVEKLSGGEKVRLLLGLMAHTKPHVLILDEPTSHLDIDSREALILALNDYSGAVLLITHDIYLAEGVADQLWLVHQGRASAYEGDLSDYRTLILSSDRPDGSKAGGKSGGKSSAPMASASKKPPVHLPAIEKRLRDSEKQLDLAETELRRLDAVLALPETYDGDKAQIARLNADRAQAEQAKIAAEQEWIDASLALESFHLAVAH